MSRDDRQTIGRHKEIALSRLHASPRWQRAGDSLLTCALQAHRSGTLAAALGHRKRVVSRFLGPLLSIASHTAGDVLNGDKLSAPATIDAVLRWMVSHAGPDPERGLDCTGRDIWLDRTSWRPLLAVACHFGFMKVPRFPDRYHSTPDEAAAEQLCGLWNVGTSTFYRYVEKGKRRILAELWRREMQGVHLMSLRRFVARETAASHPDVSARPRWHERQAALCLEVGDAASMVWHLAEAGCVDRVVEACRTYQSELAAAPDIDLIMEALIDRCDQLQQLVDLHLASAWLARARGDEAAELRCYANAMRIANVDGDKRRLSRVHHAQGNFYEPRSPDRAMAHFAACIDLLRSAVRDRAGNVEGYQDELASGLDRLAWLYVLKNDPRSRVILDEARQLASGHQLRDATTASLERTWAEYSRRAGDLPQALEHEHKALVLFEQLGDKRHAASACNNLSIIYGELKQFGTAIEFGRRVLAMADEVPVEPYLCAGALINIGACCFWSGALDEAILHYERGLEVAQRAKLHVFVDRALYNLAEAHFTKFRSYGDNVDETRGDAYVEMLSRIERAAEQAPVLEAARHVKEEVLGPRDGLVMERLVPEESAEHSEELLEIRRQRSQLLAHADLQDQIHARLKIAKAYLSIAEKERQLAVRLIDRNGLENAFAPELEQLERRFETSLSRQTALVAQWLREGVDFINVEGCKRLVRYLLDSGSIQKSDYAQLQSVGPATSSKHLSQLAQRGLLVKVGQGPATRYKLPPA